MENLSPSDPLLQATAARKIRTRMEALGLPLASVMPVLQRTHRADPVRLGSLVSKLLRRGMPNCLLAFSRSLLPAPPLLSAGDDVQTITPYVNAALEASAHPIDIQRIPRVARSVWKMMQDLQEKVEWNPSPQQLTLALSACRACADHGTSSLSLSLSLSLSFFSSPSLYNSLSFLAVTATAIFDQFVSTATPFSVLLVFLSIAESAGDPPVRTALSSLSPFFQTCLKKNNVSIKHVERARNLAQTALQRGETPLPCGDHLLLLLRTSCNFHDVPLPSPLLFPLLRRSYLLCVHVCPGTGSD